MATYKCTLFRNSGFNQFNIPDSASLLINSDISRTVLDGELKSLTINQDVQLDNLTVRCSLEQAKNVDFIMIEDNDPNSKSGDKFYSVDGRQMLATDTCSFTIRQIALLSYGGIASLDILDGITERVHVSDDDKFYSCDGDPLLLPSQPLDVVTEWVGPEHSRTLILAECVVDPIATYKDKAAVHVAWEDPVSGDTMGGIYPDVDYPEEPTVFGIGQREVSTGSTLFVVSTTDDTKTPVPNPQIKDGLKNLHALNFAQGGILRQYEFPVEMSNGVIAQTNDITDLDHLGIVKRIISKRTELTPTAAITGAVKKTAKNKLVTYSPVQKFGIMTTAGNSAEFELEDLRDGSDNICYNISMVTDPRPDGKPYFRPQWVNGEMAGSNNYGAFWRNCIAGMQWKQIPLIFTEAAGNALNTQRFQNKKLVEDISRQYEHGMLQAKEFDTLMNGMMGVASGAANGAMTGGILGGIAGGGISLYNMMSEASKQSLTDTYNKASYLATRKSELFDLYAANTLVAPTVNFPYNSDAIRDNIGNHVMCYQYTYTDLDYNRIDKLLTMYGYRISKPLEKSDFTNRQYFNFVACKNVSVTGHSQWVNDAIAEELKNGVRVWHVIPNKSYYNNNPIR